ncbi:MAG: electron transport protein SCO1/SenC [Fluviicola sp.]|jgi:protein SCO1/2|uniref:SCO family protein n=1 Tax=Fluviicola sp. TaxID=1917219 RepID=UPI00262E92FC|nr:SCO family protein [Fluviicola sp.]MDF3027918.1 electron transport protein SCO1/SenC [Fluviicola sp.]
MKQVIYVALALILFSACKTEEKKPQALPYFGNYDIVYSETDGVQSIDTVFPKIPAFSYLNQDSVVITSKSMKGKVWIANFFFTSCPSICPPMISQMKRLNILTKDLASEVQFMSFSIDPKTDQPHVLKNYIRNNGIQASNWHFFTGDEAKTHRLGVMHFMVHADKDPMAAGGFAHSDGMVLVDREGYVRGVYRGTQTREVDKLNKDLRKLLEIEYGINSKH